MIIHTRSLTLFVAAVMVAALAPQGASATTKHYAPKKDTTTPMVIASNKKLGPAVSEVDVSNIFEKQEKKPLRRKLNRAPEAAKLEISDKPAERLLESINRARLALAQNNLMASVQAIKDAQEISTTLDNDGDGVEKADIQTGHFIYYQGKHIAYHYYFPLNTELASLNGPEDTQYWSANGGTSVKDASTVNITVTFNTAETSKQLASAMHAVETFKNDEAQLILTKQVDDAIKVTSTQKLPLIKARDNIQLTRYFMAANDYAAARNALRQARDGLNEASKDKRYADNKDEIKGMGRDIVAISKDVASKDPSFIGRTAVTLENWWNSLGDLSDNPENNRENDTSEAAIINAIRQSE